MVSATGFKSGMDVEMPPAFEGNDEWESWLQSGTMRTIGEHRYLHLFVLGMVFAAFDAYGIGSNDVANAVCVPSITIVRHYILCA